MTIEAGGKIRGGRDRLYGRRWRKARRIFLSRNPFCAMCLEQDTHRPAVEVDHIQKHNGDPVLFWDVKNWQGLCSFHHRTVKAEMERSGKVRGSKVDGSPLDPDHPWNKS